MAKKSSKLKPTPIEPMTAEQVETQSVEEVKVISQNPLKPGKRPAFLQGQKTGQFIATREFSGRQHQTYLQNL